MNQQARSVLSSYIEFAKVDSKLACINNGRDFDRLSDLLNKLANIFEKNYSVDGACETINLYFSYMYTYHQELLKLFGKKQDLSPVIKSSYQKFKNDQNLASGLTAIRYLRQTIGILEKKEAYSANYAVVNNNIGSRENNFDDKKVISVSQHYKFFFETYEKYNTLCQLIKQRTNNSAEIIQSNITVISEFHQGMTHFSRYINSGHMREVYRFDSHFIRAIFDIQKLIISTLDHYVLDKKIGGRNILLMEYMNIKNIEVPGRNMSNFSEVYAKYNEVIKKYRTAADL